MTKPSLKRIEEFQDILSDYQVSDHGKQVLSRANIIIFAGATAAGRNTIINELVKTKHYSHVTSDTTRPMRVNDGIPEEDGVQYWFRSEEDVLADLKAGNFLEAAIIHEQQVSGTSIRELEEALDKEQVSILEIQRDGVDNIVREKPDTKVIWLSPPSFDEWVSRLEGRGTISEQEFKNRFLSAKAEYEHALNNDYYTFVVNDSYLLSTEHIRRIVETDDYPNGVNRSARKVAEEIYKRICEEI